MRALVRGAESEIIHPFINMDKEGTRSNTARGAKTPRHTLLAAYYLMPTVFSQGLAGAGGAGAWRVTERSVPVIDPAAMTALMRTGSR